MCVYQNIIYFCKTTFGTLIGGNVLTSHGINKACRKKADGLGASSLFQPHN